jgi:hypothetical protein
LKNLITTPTFEWKNIQNEPLYYEIKRDLLGIQAHYNDHTGEDFCNYFSSDPDHGLYNIRDEVNMEDLALFTLIFPQDSYYPPHDHHDMIVFTTCLEGQIMIDYFKHREMPNVQESEVQYQLDLIDTQTLEAGDQAEIY